MNLASACVIGLAVLCAGCAVTDEIHDTVGQQPLLSLEEARAARHHRFDGVDATYWSPAAYSGDTSYSADSPPRTRTTATHRLNGYARTRSPASPTTSKGASVDTALQGSTPRPAATVTTTSSLTAQAFVEMPASSIPTSSVAPVAVAAAAPISVPANAKPGAFDCLPDDVACQRELAEILADTTHVWTFLPPKAADYVSGVRLYAFHKTRDSLNCIELKIGLMETATTLDHLLIASNSKVISEVSRSKLLLVQQAAISIRTDLAEAEARTCATPKKS